MSEVKFYNDNIKKEFLSIFNDRTATVYSRIFVASKDAEYLLNKDLYNFGVDEVADLMQTMKPTSIKAARSNLSVIVAYIDWSYDAGYRKSNLNPIKEMGKDWLNQFVEEPEFNFFSEKQFKEYIYKLVNFQDRIITALIFYGVEGKFMSELLNLKVEDVDFENNILNLTNNNGGKRVLEMPKYVMDMIKSAINEKIYFKNNGNVKSTSKAPAFFDLNITNYVIRNRFDKRSENASIKISTLRAKIKEMQGYVGHSNFTVTNMKRSGMLFMAKNLLERDGKLGREQMFELAERYNPDFLTLDDDAKSRYVSSIRDVVNVENVKIIYPEIMIPTVK